MPKKMPSYRHRPEYGQAVVTLTDAVTKQRRDYWLGTHDSSESRERYHRVIAEWEARGRRLPPPPQQAPDSPSLTFNELALEYWRFAESYYDSATMGHLRTLLRLARQYFGSHPAASFGPSALRLVREAMIKGDPAAEPPRKPWSRPYINSQIHLLCRIFKWAASHEMLPASVYQQLKTVPALRRGRTTAPEPDPVKPVPIEMVDAVRPFLSRQVEAMVDLQLLTAARGCELFTLRPIDIQVDTRSGIWTIALDEHKTAHHGHARTIYIGPRAQEVVRPFLADRPLDTYLFSPAEAEAERRAAITGKRRTPMSCGNRVGTNRTRNPRKKPGDHYTAESYRRAIAYACDKAFPHPDPVFQPQRQTAESSDGRPTRSRLETKKEFQQRLTAEQHAELRRWRSEHRWHPHQLRHTAATLIRREFGLEAARIALGHSSALITDAVYAERDLEKVIEVMRKIG